MHLPIFGVRVGNFTYITDASFIPAKEKKKIFGSEILVLNALRYEKHLSHFTFRESLAEIKKIKPKIAYLTHISHQLGLHEKTEKKLPENIRLAYDGLVLQV